MTSTSKILTIVFALVFISHAGFAQDMISGLVAGGGLEAGSVRGPMAPEMIVSKLQQQGYTSIGSVTAVSGGNMVQTTAVAPGGMPVDLSIEPVTGSIVAATPR